MKYLTGMMVIAALAVAGCDSGVVETNFDDLPDGSVRFVNFLAGHPPMDVVVDDKTLGAQGATGMNFGAASGYAAITGGTRNLGFDTAGTDTKRKRVAANFIVTAAKGTVLASIDGNKNPYMVGLVDTIPAALTASNAAIRFVHAAATRDSVTLIFSVGSSNDSTNFVGRATRSVTQFRTIPPAVYNVSIKKKNSASPIVMKSLLIEPGKAYTLVANGNTDATLPWLDLTLLPNN